MATIQPLTLRELWRLCDQAASDVPDWDDVESPQFHRWAGLDAALTAAHEALDRRKE